MSFREPQALRGQSSTGSAPGTAARWMARRPVTIGQDGDTRVLGDTVRAQRATDHGGAGGATFAHKGKSRNPATDAPDLARHDLERAGRPRMPIAHVPAVETDDHVLTGRQWVHGGGR
jgi:hypothetical protein